MSEVIEEKIELKPFNDAITYLTSLLPKKVELKIENTLSSEKVKELLESLNPSDDAVKRILEILSRDTKKNKTEDKNVLSSANILFIQGHLAELKITVNKVALFNPKAKTADLNGLIALLQKRKLFAERKSTNKSIINEVEEFVSFLREKGIETTVETLINAGADEAKAKAYIALVERIKLSAERKSTNKAIVEEVEEYATLLKENGSEITVETLTDAGVDEAKAKVYIASKEKSLAKKQEKK
jgi:uncharacterized protein YrzB (UPF0473 family)